MRLGVNLTSPVTADAPLALLRAGHADYCELLIDNFLHVEPDAMRAELGDVPVAFHVMNSRFLEQEPPVLERMAARLRHLAEALQPIYVSDHVGCFSHRGRRLPMVMELAYDEAYDHAAARVRRWQELLGVRVHLENYPSTFRGGHAQVPFFTRLVQETGCGVLFDMSNAIVAELNTGLQAEAWTPLAATMPHFHIAGYMLEDADPPVYVDGHDSAVSPRALEFARHVAAARAADLAVTVTVERDANITEAAWREDLEAVRHAFAR